MKIVSFVFLLIILPVFLVWLSAFIYLSDFSVPVRDIKKYKSILVVFPHADDEAITTSGLMRMASSEGIRVTWVILTKGERGNPADSFDPGLKPVRVSEAKHVAKLLGVRLIQEDFGDGQVMDKKAAVEKFLKTVFEKEKPDLVLTYDLSGWYGHPDHIATTQVVNDLMKTRSKATHLWYVSLPKKVWELAGGDLPVHMAKTPGWIKDRMYPDIKVFTGVHVIQTVQSVYMYKSQYLSWRKSIPFAPIPMWFFLSMDSFEYFHQVQ